MCRCSCNLNLSIVGDDILLLLPYHSYSINSPVKHNYLYFKNKSVFTKHCYLFQTRRLSTSEAVTKMYEGRDI